MKKVLRPALRTITWATLIGVIASGGAACTGSIASDPVREPEASPKQPRGGEQAGRPENPAAGGREPAAPGGIGTVSGPSATTPACRAGTFTLGTSRMRRLTNLEFTSALRDLLALPDSARFAPTLPGEAPDENNFLNDGRVQAKTSTQHVSLYADAVDGAVSALLKEPTRLSRVVGCDIAAAGCLRAFVERFGRRAYRRPLETADIDAVAAVAETSGSGNGHIDSFGMVMRAVLGSPNFLYIVERGTPDVANANVIKLDAFAVATRLSFLLWGTGPDDRLLDDAAAGRLETATGLNVAAERMLADGRVRVAMRVFFERWLRLNELQDADRDAKEYPDFDGELKASMRQETERFIEDLAWREEGNLMDILTARSTFLDSRLAKLYGLPPPSTPWSKVSLEATGPAGMRRVGLLTQASVLTTTGRIEFKAILRGEFVRESLLCQHVTVPPDVPDAPDPTVHTELSVRQRLELHKEAGAACAACHELLDPIGFGLDQYDRIGRYIAVDEKGAAIDGKGRIAGLPSPEFQGPQELAHKLAIAPETSACVAKKAFSYAFGRAAEPADACTVAQVVDEFRSSGGSFRGLLLALVRSDAFRTRALNVTGGER